MPEGSTGRDVVEAEQVQLNAKTPVIAQPGLLATPEVLVELLLGRPDRAVNALERWPLLVATPVGAGDREQLERADLAGRRHMRALAQVDERPVLVHGRRRHRRALALRFRGEVVEDLDLERLIALGEERPTVRRRQFAPDERMIRCDARGHLRLNGGKIVRRQRPGQGEVVVEPIADGRADPELCAREELQHGLRHDVGRRVAHRVEVAVRAGIE